MHLALTFSWFGIGISMVWYFIFVARYLHLHVAVFHFSVAVFLLHGAVLTLTRRGIENPLEVFLICTYSMFILLRLMVDLQ